MAAANRLQRTGAVAIVILITAALYLPGLDGPFLLDDYGGILENPRLRQAVTSEGIDWWGAFHSGYNGQGGRGLSMASFALNLYWAGGRTISFKQVNLVLHLVNGLGIGLLTWLILDAPRRPLIPNTLSSFWVALLAMAAWLWHPINLSGVLYVVQRMTSLAALWVILGLIFYLLGRRWIDRTQPIRGWLTIGMGTSLMTLLAWNSKENGVLLPGFALLIEVFVLRFQTPRQRDRWLLISLFGSTVVLSIGGGLVYLAHYPELFDYAGRLFSLQERLLTESRVIWYYLYLMLPLTYDQLGLFHDDFAVSTSIFNPLSTFWALTGLSGLVLAIFWSWRHRPLFGFGFAVFFVGHLLESTVFPLELVFEHRNYFPSWGVFLSLVGLIDERFIRPPWRLPAAILLSMTLITWAQATRLRSEQWSNRFAFLSSQLIAHPESARANYEVGSYFLGIQEHSLRRGDRESEGYYHALARGRFLKAKSLKPNETLSLLGLLHTDDLHGHETENEWIELLLHRLAEQPLQATAIKSVVITAQCYSLGVCDNSTEEVLSVIDAILKNHGLSGRNRRAAERAADIVRSVAKVGDIPRRLPDLIDLVSAHPNEPFFLFLHANELRRQGHFEAARTIAAPLWGLAHSDILLSEPLRILRSRLIAEDSSSLVGRE